MKDKNKDYLDYLKAQMSDKHLSKADQLRLKRQEKQEIDRLNEYNPFGRAGAGAPLVDTNGKIVTRRNDLVRNSERTPNQRVVQSQVGSNDNSRVTYPTQDQSQFGSHGPGQYVNGPVHPYGGFMFYPMPMALPMNPHYPTAIHPPPNFYNSMNYPGSFNSFQHFNSNVQAPNYQFYNYARSNLSNTQQSLPQINQLQGSSQVRPPTDRKNRFEDAQPRQANGGIDDQSTYKPSDKYQANKEFAKRDYFQELQRQIEDKKRREKEDKLKEDELERIREEKFYLSVYFLNNLEPRTKRSAPSPKAGKNLAFLTSM